MAQDAENAAEGLLAYMWADPATGVIPIPVDPAQIAERLGVRVFSATLGKDVSGSLVKTPGSDAVVLLNREDSQNRRRFTCAHELGHFVRHSAVGDENFEYVEYRDSLSATGLNNDEVYANGFAAALLMPAAQLRRDATSSPDVFRLAARYSVSVDAMSWRLRNLGISF